MFPRAWHNASPSATVPRMPSTSVPPRAIDALPRQAVRDPDHWLLIVAFLVLFICGIQLLIFPFGRSQAAHALAGRAIVAGYAPIRDAWNAQAPGIGLLHAAIQVTLGRSMMAFRAIETIALVGAVLGATRITKRWIGLERAGLVGGAVFALTYVQLEINETGQPEFFAGVLLLHAVALVSREPSPRTSENDGGDVGAVARHCRVARPLLGGDDHSACMVADSPRDCSSSTT